MHFYRFTEPKAGYPVMIELFSRKPGYHLEIDEEKILTEGLVKESVQEFLDVIKDENIRLEQLGV
jgi:hypothetical protein